MLRMKLVGYRCLVHAPQGSKRECCGISRAVWKEVPQEQPRVQVADLQKMREVMRSRRFKGRIE